MHRSFEQFRILTMERAWTIAGLMSIFVCVPLVSSCGCGFQPGWANGIPNISKHTVFATHIAGLLFIALAAAGVAVLVVPCAWLQRCMQRDFGGWGVLALLMLVWSGVGLLLCSQAYAAIHAAMQKDWP